MLPADTAFAPAHARAATATACVVHSVRRGVLPADLATRRLLGCGAIREVDVGPQHRSFSAVAADVAALARLACLAVLDPPAP